MNYLKLTVLFVIILAVNKCLLKLDYTKIFKKNSVKEIFFINMILSVIIGYLFYQAIILIYELSTNLV
ncbi:DUF1146 domain-containing protein [Gemella sp. GH3]|uniref:DUF1146 domain-containing protein n=1 Tax=unclassified Gemella TaxID=2624949 RepID=UPI0015CFE641|nr:MULTISPECIES: DUF1146 domain-containing protein [unclassified Gemella]MBF0713222.1 DUF1146 domain-containing protein [Gemella sp. GH3.1]NYS50174.1 DUF1146 domain-containing protein [Gemella sp. GH3]